jgi:hypothetical protein
VRQFGFSVLGTNAMIYTRMKSIISHFVSDSQILFASSLFPLFALFLSFHKATVCIDNATTLWNHYGALF